MIVWTEERWRWKQRETLWMGGHQQRTMDQRNVLLLSPLRISNSCRSFYLIRDNLFFTRDFIFTFYCERIFCTKAYIFLICVNLIYNFFLVLARTLVSKHWFVNNGCKNWWQVLEFLPSCHFKNSMTMIKYTEWRLWYMVWRLSQNNHGSWTDVRHSLLVTSMYNNTINRALCHWKLITKLPFWVISSVSKLTLDLIVVRLTDR